jgi:hypothetical protein
MSRRLALVVLVGLVAAPAARACDSCSIYTFVTAKDHHPGWFGGLFLQRADLSGLVEDGRSADNEFDQRLESLVTQTFVGYQFERGFSVQLSVPYLDRSFRRVAAVEEDHHGLVRTPDKHGAPELEDGSESGLGDIAIVGSWRAFERLTADGNIVWTVSAGVELPTGNSDRLEEHHSHHEEHGALSSNNKHGAEATSAVGGHELALGSGSTDLLLGTQLVASRGRMLGRAGAQYAVREEGDHEYHFGNEFMWNVSAGYFLVATHGQTLAFSLRVAGDHRDADEIGGEVHAGTDLSTLWAGPTLAYAGSTGWSSEVDFEYRLDESTSGALLLPDWRLRLAVTRRWGNS